jgi:hypothetical protein
VRRARNWTVMMLLALVRSRQELNALVAAC